MTANTAALILRELYLSPSGTFDYSALPPATHEALSDAAQGLADHNLVMVDDTTVSLLPDPAESRWTDIAVRRIDRVVRTMLLDLEGESPRSPNTWDNLQPRFEADHCRAAVERLVRHGLAVMRDGQVHDLTPMHPQSRPPLSPKLVAAPRTQSSAPPPKAAQPQRPAPAASRPADSVDAAVRRAVSSALMQFGWMALNSAVSDHGKSEVEQALAKLVDEGLIHVVDDGTWGKGRKPVPAPKPEPVPAPKVEVVESAPDTAPEKTDENNDIAPEPAPETMKKSSTSSTLSVDFFTEAINATILEVREVRRDIRQALAPVVAAKLDTSAAHDLIRNSDEMTGKVLFRVVVCLHTYGEMTRSELRKKFNSNRLPHLPEAIALGLRIGAIDANARGGRALRLIDHSAVMSDADLERAAAEQRQRDESNRRVHPFGRVS